MRETTTAVGNGAKMREALVSLSAWVKVVKNNPKDKTAIECAEFVEETIKAALAAPPRNCDVGDADDWEMRFGEECDKGHICSDCPVRHAKTKMAIEFNKGAKCEFIWAQMPYEEGGGEA